MKKFFTHFLMAFAAVIVLTITLNLSAQTTTGSIYGAVADSSGAAIPNASVTIKDVHSGATQSTMTNNSGEYTFPVVQPSDYAVSSTAQGFKTQTQTGVALSANENVHVTFSLTAGAVTENVDVEAGLTLVDTRESQLGETIDQQRLQDLPTLNRSTYDLVQLMPGVTNYNADTQTGSRDGTKFSVNGMPTDMVSGYIDGAYNDSYKQGGLNKVPNPDALQEFRVLTSNFDAEFGRSPGGVVNVITRSGTQHYHGTAYEYVRNDLFNARNYFQSPGPRQPYKQNQFGGTFGGPVPVVKNTFMFFSYEELLLHQTANVNAGTIIVPTDRERQGDFSQST
ncbi:MAG TPA: TonB-dependent receptor, partial [Bryocella sp.]|nr:TonB-dependent receptor [Bryocella sp.]